MIKKAIQDFKPIPLVSMPPKLQEHYEEMEQLKSWHQSYQFFALQPPINIRGVVTA